MATKEHLENERLTREICLGREIDGQRYEPGAFLAIAEGRVVGVGRSFEDADAQLASFGTRVGRGNGLRSNRIHR